MHEKGKAKAKLYKMHRSDGIYMPDILHIRFYDLTAASFNSTAATQLVARSYTRTGEPNRMSTKMANILLLSVALPEARRQRSNISYRRLAGVNPLEALNDILSGHRRYRNG